MVAPGADISGEMAFSSLQGPNSSDFANWSQQGGSLQLPSLQELTPLDTQIISPVLANAFGIPHTSNGNGNRSSGNQQQAQSHQQQPAQQENQPMQQASLQQQQQQAAGVQQYQQMANMMPGAAQYPGGGMGLDGQDRQNYGQQFAAFSLGYSGLGQGLQHSGQANTGYPSFTHPNLYGFDPAVAMASQYNLNQGEAFLAHTCMHTKDVVCCA